MYRIRLHGRGGQGIKTAARMLGSALFRAGFNVQDAPRYGAERRGAPIFAYVRAAEGALHERGVILHPDLAVVVDDTLVALPAAGVLQGLDRQGVLLIVGGDSAEHWRERLRLDAEIIVLDLAAEEEGEARPLAAAAAIGAAARLLGVIAPPTLRAAITEELADKPERVVAQTTARAMAAYDAMAGYEGRVRQRAAQGAEDGAPDWVLLPLDAADVAAPAIHKGATSVLVRTGLWRVMRPLLVKDECNKCIWVCGSFCPDGVIAVDADGYPRIDYDHCKGCLVCVAQCPKHALLAIPEPQAAAPGAPA